MAGLVGDIIAVAGTYEDLVQACIVRRRELGLSQLAVDEISGLQSGYVGKLEIGIKRLGALSLPCLLQALGLELVVRRAIPHHELQNRVSPMSACGRSQDASGPRAARAA